MKPIKQWDDAKPFVNIIVACTSSNYIHNKNAYRINSANEIIYGYVQSYWRNEPYHFCTYPVHNDTDGGFAFKLVTLCKKNISADHYMTNYALSLNNLHMRGATAQEAITINQAINDGYANFDYNDERALSALIELRYQK